jgi:hypothetical protein
MGNAAKEREVREKKPATEFQHELLRLLDRTTWDETDPTRDRRVAWMLNELDDVCSPLALRNLCVDITRERQGGRRARTVSIEGVAADEHEILAEQAEQAERIQDEDTRLAWRGLIGMWKSECGNPGDDVLIVLTLLAEHPELETGFGSQWPIKMITNLLNEKNVKSSWNQRKVDNAKERLARWITKKKQGLYNFDDFEALLARVGRKLEERERIRKETPAEVGLVSNR